MDRGYPLKSGSIDQTHPGKRRVHAARLKLALPHLALELLEIEPGRRRLTTPDRATMAMDDILVRALAVNLVVDLVVVVRQQRYADSLVTGDHDRLRPDHIAQLQDRRFRTRGHCALDRRPSHFQIGHSGQDFLCGAAICTYLMIRQEELFSLKVEL